MRKNILFVLLLVAVTFEGCRKDSPDVVHPSEVSLTIYTENYWSDLFDLYWSAMSQSYLFWKYETIDWDAVYDEYAPKFAECDDLCINNEDEYFTYVDDAFDDNGDAMYYGDNLARVLFNEIAQQLLDHHYALKLYDVNTEMPGSAYNDVINRDYYHAYNDIGLVAGLEHILEYEQNEGRITNLMSGEYQVDEGFSRNLRIISYLIDGSIPYLYFSDFAISSYASDVDDPGFETPIDPNDNKKSEVLDNFEYLVKNTPNMKGAIIDVRGNGGGYNDDLNVVLGRFINENEKIHFANTQHKSGPNRYDYTQLTPSYIYGTSEDQTYKFPIITLADIHSVSMGEMINIATRSFSDDCIMVGERTFGATCSLLGDRYFAGGIVTSDNFEIYTSSFLFYDLDNNFYEGVGITPDIEVLFEESTWGTTTTDNQKEAAIEYINNL